MFFPLGNWFLFHLPPNISKPTAGDKTRSVSYKIYFVASRKIPHEN